ncbi:NADAR family protein [Streptomyces aurantiogriseus]|uniref:NADAR domain-containing protein n=1 Tax=Streptomyces aurantiogriseus TaxID=66870 RepID=A0A918CKA8_9ACTN|nr:NADAR family protein [Streptomyces aurantiogriseus]GGR28927.1 hypothetical protein GCM10010251_51420 [Streptomyces aurantiogriseus]
MAPHDAARSPGASTAHAAGSARAVISVRRARTRAGRVVRGLSGRRACCTKALRNDYPAPIDADGVTYPSVAHAYWALTVADPGNRAAITAADSAFAARTQAAGAPRRDGWEQARTAVLTALLRAKYTQHPTLAEILLATDDSTLVHDDIDSGFRGDNAGRGRNWTGRLLNSSAPNCTPSARESVRTGDVGAPRPGPEAASPRPTRRLRHRRPPRDRPSHSHTSRHHEVDRRVHLPCRASHVTSPPTPLPPARPRRRLGSERFPRRATVP